MDAVNHLLSKLVVVRPEAVGRPAIAAAGLPPWGVELVAMVVPIVLLVALWLAWLLFSRMNRVPRVMRESMSPEMLPLDRRWLQSGWAAIAFAFVSMAAENLLLRSSVGQSIRTAALLAPILPLGWFIVSWRREVSRGDELDRRIHLDALTFAFPAFVVVMAGSRLLEAAHWPTPPASVRWQFMPFLFGLGIWISKFFYAGPDADQGGDAGKSSPGGTHERERSTRGGPG